MTDTIPPQQILEFLRCSPTPYHAVANLCHLLDQAGFTRIDETDDGEIPGPGRYYLIRDQGSLAILQIGTAPLTQGLRLAGAHTDSPCLKLKPVSGQIRHGCGQAGVEVYGGALLLPWFDRDLSLAGRVSWLDGEDRQPRQALIDFQRPVALIPSLAIHLDRNANKERTVNRQTDLVPVFLAGGDQKRDFLDQAVLTRIRQEQAGSDPRRLLSHELFLYDSQPPALVGLNRDLISGGRLDNLLSCYLLTRCLTETTAGHHSLVLLYNHEEVGSQTMAGAQSSLLADILDRLLPDARQRRQALARSLLLSVDNAHAVHPNFSDRHDPDHRVRLGGGPVLKWNACQRYATDAVGATLVKGLCDRLELPCQEFVMRSDLACGSTIGPLISSQAGVRTVDLGLPSLGMHSIRETASIHDLAPMTLLLRHFFDLAPDDPLWRGLTP